MATTYYIDTSALVKRYHVEEGTTFLDEVFSESDATFVIGSITIAEPTSAVAQKSRLGGNLSRNPAPSAREVCERRDRRVMDR